MPRKGPAPKRPLVNDPVYGSPLVTQLVNKVLIDGKKSTAESIVYGALEMCREKTGTDPVTLSRRLSITFVLLLKFVPAASVALPTRFLLRSVLAVPLRLLCAGSSRFPGNVARRRWRSASLTNCLMPPTVLAHL